VRLQVKDKCSLSFWDENKRHDFDEKMTTLAMISIFTRRFQDAKNVAYS